MKKVGFIDYYLDEWHANNYPEFIKNRSNGEFEVCFAYGKIDSPLGGMTNTEWAAKYNITLCKTPEEVVEKSDVLIVLSPDNPEMHEELCDAPLKSGKLVYIDKTFAPTREAALRIFDKADRYNTKCYSSSALGFSSELDEIEKKEIDAIYTGGPGVFDIYVIHQTEPVIRLMDTPVKRVMYTGTNAHPAAVIEFSDGRLWHMFMRSDKSESFEYTVVDRNNRAETITVKSDYFGLFIDALIKFFETGEVQVSHERTVEVITVIEALKKARKKPFEHIDLI